MSDEEDITQPDWDRLSELGLELDEDGRNGVLEAMKRLHAYDMPEPTWTRSRVLRLKAFFMSARPWNNRRA